MKKIIHVYILIYIVLLSHFYVIHFPNYFETNINESKTNNRKELHEFDLKYADGDDNKSKIIVFFNTSYFSEAVIESFEYYGGDADKESIWNNTFASLSGFGGVFPNSNITSFKSSWDKINIEKNEIIEAQMNYASLQSGAINITNYLSGFRGETNSSIALLDSGIESTHKFFPLGYNFQNLQGDIVGWKDFVNDAQIPLDDYGHGTFISSIITGEGTLPYNSTSPLNIHIKKNYSHTELFNDAGEMGNFSLKILSFNTSHNNLNIVLNASWNFETPGIDNLWIELYRNETELVASNNSLIPNRQFTLNYSTLNDESSVYDLYIKYHKGDNTFPNFSFDINASFIPEFYAKGYSYFTGIANGSKIVSFRIINETGIGYTSDLITALADVIHNKSKYHIISVCLSVGTLGKDVSAVNRAINNVIDNGTLVIIAAGNYGPSNSDCLNKLALNKYAIVVGSINDKDQITSYSSRGKTLEEGIIKPDILAPGGSKLPGHRSIIGADSRSNVTTAAYGTSISAAIVSATVNLLIEAKWGNWNKWYGFDVVQRNKIIKATLLMTASETNLEREDDPETDGIDESDFSPTNFIGTSFSLRDEHEGYGRINIQAAIDALTKSTEVNDILEGYIESSENNPLGNHVLARRIVLTPNSQYLINLTDVDEDSDLDIFLYSNETTQYGEPILLGASQTILGDPDYFYFIPKENETECILIIKAIEGNSTFKVNVSIVENLHPPELSLPEVSSLTGDFSKNTTIMSYEEFAFGDTSFDNYTTGTYYFFINYTDIDKSNIPPQEVYVSIEEMGRNYSMTPRFLFNNYTEGALFISELVKFSKPGIYHYFFSASDGKKVEYPQMDMLNVSIVYPTKIKEVPYNHSFNDGIEDWYYTGTGWGLLNQSNQNDDRSGIYPSGSWKSMYFGNSRNHNYPSNYSYQRVYYSEESPNGTLYSPIFNLTGLNRNTELFAKFGLRISINTLDSIELQINANWSGWEELESYSNTEKEWFLEVINLSDYKDSIIQFRFISNIDTIYDSIKNKGFMLDYFCLENYSNSNTPSINFDIVLDIKPLEGSNFQKFTFLCVYFDKDNNYPEYIYLETYNEDDLLTNHSMYNIYGNWIANSTQGIKFRYSLVIGEISNRSFRFHISDGKYTNCSNWYNQDNSYIKLNNPSNLQNNYFKNGKAIGYSFSNDNLDAFFVSGIPDQGEVTAWLKGDSTWHITYHRDLQQNVIYGGTGQLIGFREGQGYDKDWNAKLITHPIRIMGTYPTYLQFTQNISLQNEVLNEDDDYDTCSISISTNYGNEWEVLEEYKYDSNSLDANKKLDLSDYSQEVIMIKFTLYSNDDEPPAWISGSIGNGWILYDLYVGYDKSTDLIEPVIDFSNLRKNEIIHSEFTVEISITDNIRIDEDRIDFFIEDDSISSDDFDFDEEEGILEYDWNTIDYEDGEYELKVVAYDYQGNRVEKTMTIFIDNSLFYWLELTIEGSDKSKPEIWSTWIPIIGLIILVSAIGSAVYAKKKRRTDWIRKIKKRNLNAKNIKSLSKEDVIKKIKNLSLEEELKRPIILKCKFCDSWFYQENDKFDIFCPLCEHDQIYAAYNCLNCQKWYFQDEPGEDYYCPKCSVKEKRKKDTDKKLKLIKKKEKILLKKESIRLIRRKKEEVVNILEKEGKVLRNFEPKNSEKLDILNL
jgi:DNA-directed RNA polymerase subunit RPC12/RpoP